MKCQMPMRHARPTKSWRWCATVATTREGGGGGRTASIPMSREKHKLRGGAALLCSPSFFLLYIQCTPYAACPLC